MEWISAITQMMFFVALGGALYLLVRFRDWRLGFLVLLILLMNVQQIVGTLGASDIVMSFAAIAAVFFLERLLRLNEQVRRDLASSQERISGFLDLASDWTLEFDEQLRFKRAEDSVARRLLRTTGLNLDRGIGLTRWELAGVENPEDDPNWASHYADLLAHREFRDFRYSFADGQGNTRHLRVSGRPQFDESGKFSGYFSVGTEETLQVEAKLKAEEAETRLRDAIENIPNPTLILDPDDRVALFNKAWRDWYPDLAHFVTPDIRYEDLVHHISDSGLWDPMGPRDTVLEDRLRHHRHGAGSYEQELSDGRFILIGESRTQNGGRIITHTDITDLKRIDQLKDEFISMVSHELRTPLTSIKGSLDLLSAGVTENRTVDADRLVDIAKRNADRLLLIVNDILDAQKIESGDMRYDLQPVELMPLVKRSVAANEIFGDKHRVSFRLKEEVPGARVEVDIQRFDQVLANLLSNAAKFAPNGSVVDVAARRRNGGVRVSVHDEGPGIPNELHDRVFERFWQEDTSDSRGAAGTGLGLSISKKIVEDMGGQISFESHEGGGCTFHLDLPEAHETNA